MMLCTKLRIFATKYKAATYSECFIHKDGSTKIATPMKFMTCCETQELPICLSIIDAKDGRWRRTTT